MKHNKTQPCRRCILEGKINPRTVFVLQTFEKSKIFKKEMHPIEVGIRSLIYEM